LRDIRQRVARQNDEFQDADHQFVIPLDAALGLAGVALAETT
jgi:hypothetical protein